MFRKIGNIWHVAGMHDDFICSVVGTADDIATIRQHMQGKRVSWLHKQVIYP